MENKVKPKVRCDFQSCKKKIGILCFHCRFCESNFCVQHQLPETHACDLRNSEAYKVYKTENMLPCCVITAKETLKTDLQKLKR